MLNRKTKQLMKAIYYKAVEKDGTCLISQNDLLSSMPYSFQFKKSDLAPALKALVSEGYFELITTEKKGEEYYCITLQKGGYDFAYQIAKEKRQVRMKIALTVSGAVLSFIIGINGVGNVRYKKMFGEYMVYVNDKPVLLVCDDTVFVKQLDIIADDMANASKGLPYEGTKEHYILDIDDADLAIKVVEKLEKVTPLPKSRKKK